MFPETRIAFAPPNVSDEELAAAIAAVSTFLDDRERVSQPPSHNFWSRAGRLEAQGVPVTRHSLLSGWQG